MNLKKKIPLGLEALEDRWVPATVRFDGANLYITNPFIKAGKSAVVVTESGPNTFAVTDDGQSNGSYLVTGNITIVGNNASDTVTVTPNASGILGNLSVRTGNGASSVSVNGGKILGNAS